MRKSTLYILCAIMTVAVSGIVLSQLYWINNAYSVKNEQVELRVSAALDEVVAVVSELDALETTREYVLERLQSIRDTTPAVVAASSAPQSAAAPAPVGTFKPKGTLKLELQVNGDVSKQLTIESKNLNTQTVNRQVKRFVHKAEFDSSVYVTMSPQTSDHEVVVFGNMMEMQWIREELDREHEQLDRENEQLDNKLKLIEDLVVRLSQPKAFTDRVEPHKVDSLLSAALTQRGIESQYECRIIPLNDSLFPTSQSVEDTILAENTFSRQLFPADKLNEAGLLTLTLPDLSGDVLKSMWDIIGLSGACILMVVCAYIYTIRLMLQQKKLSEMKTDFINNMTHELKTPITAIGLAGEALSEGRVLAQPDTVNRYVSLIRQENKRLAGQVENVLQAARLDRGSIELQREMCNVCDLVRSSTDALKLRIESKGGTLSIHHAGSECTALVDPMHITNVIHNLVDNAEKYSEGSPAITIATTSHEGHIELVVADEGIGMTKQELQHASEKFYRVPTGNIHNVKGFGLGLFYVSRIVEAHGGNVQIQSQKGVGTSVHISLPKQGVALHE